MIETTTLGDQAGDSGNPVAGVVDQVGLAAAMGLNSDSLNRLLSATRRM